MNKYYDIIVRSKKITISKGLFLISIFPVSIALIFLPIENKNTYFSIAAIFWIITSIILVFFIPSYKIIGDLVFKSNSIIIKNKTISLLEIKYFSINIKSYFGDINNWNMLYLKPPIEDGANNKIVIKTTENIIYECSFKIDSFQDMNTLEKIIKVYHKNGITIK